MSIQTGIYVTPRGTEVDLLIVRPNGHRFGMILTSDVSFDVATSLMSAATHAQKAANDEP